MALYGNSGPSESLYGAQRPAQEPLSQDNQNTAQQLSLPGHESQAAGSQQAAQSNWANFEDVFNKNQGYAKSSLDNAKNKVALAGVDYSGVKPNTHTSNREQAPKAPAGTVNPTAPAQLQAGNLAGIQSKSDHLSGFGGEQELSAYGGGPQNVLGGQAQVKPSRTNQPVAYQQANTAAAPRERGPIDVQNAPVPPVMDGYAGGKDDGRQGPETNSGPEVNPNATPIVPPGTAPVSKDRGATLLPSLVAQAKAPAGITKDEFAKDKEYTDKNDMLAGWGDDNGLDVLRQVYGSEATQTDADIMGAAGGRTAQGDLSRKYGQEQKDFRAGVEGRVADSKAAGDAARKQLGNLQAASQQNAQIQPDGSAKLEPTPSTPQEVGELNQLLFNGNDQNAWSGMHAVGMTLNPADWAVVGMGEAGTDIEPTTEMFGHMYSGMTGQGTSNVAASWPQGKFLMAYKMLVHGPEYDGAPKQAFLNALKNTPGMLQEYLSMKNPGFMARNMRAWMQSWRQTQAANQPGQAQAAAQMGPEQLAALMQGWAVDSGAVKGGVQSNGLGFSF